MLYVKNPFPLSCLQGGDFRVFFSIIYFNEAITVNNRHFGSLGRVSLDYVFDVMSKELNRFQLYFKAQCDNVEFDKNQSNELISLNFTRIRIEQSDHKLHFKFQKIKISFQHARRSYSNGLSHQRNV